ncbi:hypothetical protein [Leeuwenhoekiella sp. MAR_2009_132]|nr:hypothetical protein [Leeuwenhoekiella sp. MAR_2009_132]
MSATVNTLIRIQRAKRELEKTPEGIKQKLNQDLAIAASKNTKPHFDA